MVPMLDTLEVLYLSKNNRLTTCTVRRSINTGQLAATEPIQTNLFIFQSQPDCGRSGRTEMDKLVVSKAQHKESDDLEEYLFGHINSPLPSELSWGILDVPKNSRIPSWSTIQHVARYPCMYIASHLTIYEIQL